MRKEQIFILLAAVFCVCLVASNIFENVIFDAGPLTLTGGFLIFPVSYIINDCLSEIYGYSRTRRVILLAFALNLLFVLLAQLVTLLPEAAMSEGWTGEVTPQQHFTAIFRADLRITAASMLAFVCGALINARVMVKMKGHSRFGVRAIVSSLAGESLDSLIFFPIAFWGIGAGNLAVLMLTQIFLKTLYEVIVLPLTSLIVKKLKALPDEEATTDGEQFRTIARIRNDFPTKFGLPRQSGMAPSLRSRIVFEPDFRNADALRGMEGFSHLWLIWDFSAFHSRDGKWSPTVRPPRLGGNVRLGVFATRSPNRPNPIGLSCVKIEKIEPDTPDGPVITVLGADLMDGTPILDIKPYVKGADSHPDSADGFVGEHPQHLLEVEIPSAAAQSLSEDELTTLREVLSQDPRPAYQNDPGRVYGLSYAGKDVRFRVEGDVLSVIEIV